MEFQVINRATKAQQPQDRICAIPIRHSTRSQPHSVVSPKAHRLALQRAEPIRTSVSDGSVGGAYEWWTLQGERHKSGDAQEPPGPVLALSGWYLV